MARLVADRPGTVSTETRKEDRREDNVPQDDSTYGECDEPRLTDDRRLQDMIDATPCVVVDFLLARRKQIAKSELEDAWQQTRGQPVMLCYVRKVKNSQWQLVS